MVADWPKFNTKAWLRLPCCGDEHPTRVEDITDKDDCVIAAPQAPHKEPVSTKQAKKGFFLGWVDRTTALEVPVALVDSQTEPIPMWTVTWKGKAEEVTRRRFVRVPYKADVTMHLLERGAPVQVITKDISEGGFSCEVDQWANDPQGKVFETKVTIDGTEFALKAQVAWWGRMNEQDRRFIGIQFVDTPPKIGDQVRSFVFNEQLRQRQARNK